jgi:hypothetical protein
VGQQAFRKTLRRLTMGSSQVTIEFAPSVEHSKKRGQAFESLTDRFGGIGVKD